MVEKVVYGLNHQKYDHVFRIVFSDKDNLLSLYNALSGKDYDNPDDLVTNTLENAVYLGMKNDISFVIEQRLNLYEHQSTLNPNMPLRGFYYFSDLYRTKYYGERLYRSKRIMLETPRYVVFYNGKEEIPDRMEMKLSDSYITPCDDPDLEVTAHIININPGHNGDLSDKCQILYEYSMFSGMMREALEAATEENAAEIALEVINECISKGILKDILQKEKNRVMDTILSQFNAEEYIKMEREDSFNDGSKRGKQELLISMVKDGEITVESAAHRLGVSVEEFEVGMNEYLES